MSVLPLHYGMSMLVRCAKSGAGEALTEIWVVSHTGGDPGPDGPAIGGVVQQAVQEAGEGALQLVRTVHRDRHQDAPKERLSMAANAHFGSVCGVHHVQPLRSRPSCSVRAVAGQKSTSSELQHWNILQVAGRL